MSKKKTNGNHKNHSRPASRILAAVPASKLEAGETAPIIPEGAHVIRAPNDPPGVVQPPRDDGPITELLNRVSHAAAIGCNDPAITWGAVGREYDQDGVHEVEITIYTAASVTPAQHHCARRAALKEARYSAFCKGKTVTVAAHCGGYAAPPSELVSAPIAAPPAPNGAGAPS